MATAAVLGKGVLLQRSDGTSPITYSTVAEMLDIPDAPDTIRDLVDVTNHDSPGTDREYILGLGDGVEIQGRCNYTNSTQQNALLTDKAAGTAVMFRMEFPMYTPSRVCTFEALVRNWTLNPPVDAQVTLSFTLKTTGLPVWTP